MTVLAQDFRAPHVNQRWLKCTGASDSFAVNAVTAATLVDSVQVSAALELPTADGQINGIVFVGPNKQLCTIDFPVWAKYTGGTPAVGEEWGCVHDSDALQEGYPGFICLSAGVTSGTGNGIVLVDRTYVGQFYLGKVITSAITAGSTGTVRMHNQAWSATSPAIDFTVYNPHDVDLPVDLKVRWGRYPGWTNWIVEPWQWKKCAT